MRNQLFNNPVTAPGPAPTASASPSAGTTPGGRPPPGSYAQPQAPAIDQPSNRGGRKEYKTLADRQHRLRRPLSCDVAQVFCTQQIRNSDYRRRHRQSTTVSTPNGAGGGRHPPTLHGEVL